VVNIDQRTSFPGEKITRSVAGVRQRVVHQPDPRGVPACLALMRYQPARRLAL
jgi:hypothetical protein